MEQVLEGVSESVSEVQDCAKPRLSLVRLDHAGLDPAGAQDQVQDRVGMPRQHRRRVALQSAEQNRIPDHGRLDRLGQAGTEFPLRQRLQKSEIGEDRPRRVEGPDHVLPPGVVHRRLSADCRIHHRQKRRRDRDEGDAPVIGGGRESRQVANHPAPQGEHGRIPAASEGEDAVLEPRLRLAGLGPFTCRNRKEGDSEARATQGSEERPPVEPADAGVGDQEVTVGGRQPPERTRERREDAPPDGDRIGNAARPPPADPDHPSVNASRHGELRRRGLGRGSSGPRTSVPPSGPAAPPGTPPRAAGSCHRPATIGSACRRLPGRCPPPFPGAR